MKRTKTTPVDRAARAFSLTAEDFSESFRDLAAELGTLPDHGTEEDRDVFFTQLAALSAAMLILTGELQAAVTAYVSEAE